MSPTLTGVLALLLAMGIGPIFSVNSYSSVAHTLSQLGAQGAPGRWIVNAGFVTFGLGVFVDALRRFGSEPLGAACFLVFGGAMALCGVYSHRPIDLALAYDPTEDKWHSVFAMAMGFAFTFGTAWFAWKAGPTMHRLAGMAAAATAVVLPLGMVVVPGLQGLIQRLMFFVSFAWLIAYLPPRRGRS